MRKRVEGPSKITGKSKYIDDIKMPNMIYGATVRAPVVRGVLEEVIFDPSISWDEFTIVTPKDIPGKNIVSMIVDDWPYLAQKEIAHHGQAVALIAHEDPQQLNRALNLIKVKCKELPPLLEIEDSLKCREVIWGKDNIQKQYTINKGDVDSIWKKASKIFEAEYSTEAQEHLYIETNGIIATANQKEGVTIWGSLQCPYYVHSALVDLFNLPEDKVRVIQVETGGGFGGKEDFPSLLAGHASLLAWKSNRPVKMIYSRDEDIAHTTKRHPSYSKHKMAVSNDGKILAWEIDFHLDGGAYATLSSVVLSRGCIHAAGPYYSENIRVNAKALATNKFPFGAFRGFGAPQSIFATERFMNFVAKNLKMDPLEFRKKNFIKKGQTTATGQVINEEVNFDKLCTRAVDELKKMPRPKLEKFQKSGTGIAAFVHGAGFTGSGEVYLASVVGVEATKEGKIRVLASSTEIGQGKNTIFSMIASSALNLPIELVEIANPDTAHVPDSGPTVASRTTMVVGKLVESACVGLLQTLQKTGFLKENYNSNEFVEAVLNYQKEHGNLKILSKYKHPPDVHWDDQNYQGSAYATYAWAVYAAEVSVDQLSYECKVENFVAVQEIGKTLHPLLAEGQIEGGVLQAIGMAIYERVKYQKGIIVNNQMTNYIIPTAGDAPNMKIIFEEWNQQYGPSGAKGIGELPMDGPAPAILNAIEDATSFDLHHIPVLPEDIFEYGENNA